jgi:hypothetical protein
VSSITWTPEELSCERTLIEGSFWRAVEAQHRKSTMKLVDSLDEQIILEQEIEAAKPVAVSGSECFDYLLFTPFRYRGPYPSGSRFRRAGLTEGVFYCCESPITAMAEMAFLRLLFQAESPGTPFPSNPAEYTLFTAQVRTSHGLDTTRPRLVRDAELWTRLSDYTSCQALAETSRQCGMQAIRYRSVRDPSAGFNLALLSLNAFSSKRTGNVQSWHLQFQRQVAWAKCEAPGQTVSFEASFFLRDDRLASLRAALLN